MSSAPDKSAVVEHSDVELVLRYRHGWGKLGPYFKGLQQGHLLGARCQTCHALWIPPRRACRCGCVELAWETHSAVGSVEGVTYAHSRAVGIQSADPRWVLVRFDGAQALSLAQCQGIDEVTLGHRVKVVRCGEGSHEMPTLIVEAFLQT